MGAVGLSGHRGRKGRRGGAAGWAARVGVCLVIVGLVAGCVHRSGSPETGSAAVCGCVEVVVHEDLDYLLPRQVRRSPIQVILEPEDEHARGRRWIRIHTDRDGCFYQDGLVPGRYRVVKIRAIGTRQGNPGLPAPDLEFDLWESALRVGVDGVTAVPTASGRLEVAVFDLAEHEVRYLGHFVLEYRREAYPEPTAPGSGGGAARPRMNPLEGAATRPSGSRGCLTRMARIRGVAGEVYLSSFPVGTRLCVDTREDEAEACSEAGSE